MTTDHRSTGPKPLRYPSGFMYGFIGGATLDAFCRQAMREPLSARPFSYIKVGCFFGFLCSWWDHGRRAMLQDVLISEERQRYHDSIKMINYTARYGEEDDIQNLTEYLTNYTLKP